MPRAQRFPKSRKPRPTFLAVLPVRTGTAQVTNSTSQATPSNVTVSHMLSASDEVMSSNLSPSVLVSDDDPEFGTHTAAREETKQSASSIDSAMADVTNIESAERIQSHDDTTISQTKKKLNKNSLNKDYPRSHVKRKGDHEKDVARGRDRLLRKNAKLKQEIAQLKAENEHLKEETALCKDILCNLREA